MINKTGPSARIQIKSGITNGNPGSKFLLGMTVAKSAAAQFASIEELLLILAEYVGRASLATGESTRAADERIGKRSGHALVPLPLELEVQLRLHGQAIGTSRASR